MNQNLKQIIFNVNSLLRHDKNAIKVQIHYLKNNN